MNLLIVYVNITIAALGMGFVYPLIPLVLKQADISPSFIGFAGTLMALAGALAALPAGRLIDCLGSKKVIAAGLTFYGISMFLFPLMNNWLGFTLLRIVEGAGGAAVWVGTETMLNLLSSPANRARNLGFYTTCVGIGFGLGPLMGSFLMRFNEYYAFWACTIIIVGALLVTCLFLDNLTGHLEKTGTGAGKGIARRINLSLGAVLLYAIAETSLTSLLALYLKEIGYTVTFTGLVFSFLVLGGVIFPPLSGMLADRFGKVRVISGALMIAVVVAVVFPLLRELPVILGAALIFGAAMGSVYVAGLAMIGDRVRPSELGAANALFTTYYGIGGIIGPFFGGLAFQYLGREFLFYEVSVFALGLWIYSLLMKKETNAGTVGA